jgi:putative two-component system response regulator
MMLGTAVRRPHLDTRAMIAAPSVTAAPTILVVDDNPSICDLLRDELTAIGYRVITAASAEAALVVLTGIAPDLVLTDVHMGAMSGVELCAHLKHDPRFELTPIILLTGAADLDARVAGLAAGADDFFAKPFDFTELRTRVTALLRVKSVLAQLERAEGVITTLGLTIEARDPYTGGHCERLSRYAVSLGQALGADDETLKALRLGGYLHDLGKIAVADGILLKPGPLDTDERRKIETHAAVGADLVRGLRTLDGVRDIIRHHHERWDGTGYPDRLKGEEIPYGARIMAVLDVYDALRTARPYKTALGREQALAILARETDRGSWDPRVVATFLEILPELGPA